MHIHDAQILGDSLQVYMHSASNVVIIWVAASNQMIIVHACSCLVCKFSYLNIYFYNKSWNLIQKPA